MEQIDNFVKKHNVCLYNDYVHLYKNKLIETNLIDEFIEKHKDIIDYCDYLKWCVRHNYDIDFSYSKFIYYLFDEYLFSFISNFRKINGTLIKIINLSNNCITFLEYILQSENTKVIEISECYIIYNIFKKILENNTLNTECNIYMRYYNITSLINTINKS